MAVSQAVATVTTMATTHASLWSPLDANSDSRQEALGSKIQLLIGKLFIISRIMSTAADLEFSKALSLEKAFASP